MAGPGKRGAASAKVKSPAKKKAKQRTTLNSGGLGRFLERSRERLRGLRGSKDNVTDNEPPSIIVTSERDQGQGELENSQRKQDSQTLGSQNQRKQGSQTLGSQNARKQDSQTLGVQNARTPKSSSTPHETPTHGERRSPASRMESDNSGLSDIEIRYDAAAAKRLEGSDESVDQLILSNPTEDNLKLMLTTLTSRIETFGLDFRQNEGWKNKFELKGKEFHRKLEALMNACTANNELILLDKAYELRANLDQNLANLRQFAQDEANTPLRDMIRRPTLRSDNPFATANRIGRSPTRSPQSGGQLPYCAPNTVEQSAGVDDETQYHDTAAAAEEGDPKSVPKNTDKLVDKLDTMDVVINGIRSDMTKLKAAIQCKPGATEVADLKADVAQIEEAIKAANFKNMMESFQTMSGQIHNLVENQGRNDRLIGNLFRDFIGIKEVIQSVQSEQEIMRKEHIAMKRDINVLNDVTCCDLIPNLDQRSEAGSVQSQIGNELEIARKSARRNLYTDRVQGTSSYQKSASVPQPGRPQAQPHVWQDPRSCAQSVLTTNAENIYIPGTIQQKTMPSHPPFSMEERLAALNIPVSQLPNAPILTYPYTNQAQANLQQVCTQSSQTMLITSTTVTQAGRPGGQGSVTAPGGSLLPQTVIQAPLYNAQMANQNALNPPRPALPQVPCDRATWLNQSAIALIGKLVPEIGSAEMNKVTVINLHKSKLTAVDNDRKELLQYLEKYRDKTPYPIPQLIIDVHSAASQAKEWVDGVRDLYNTMECGNKDIDEKLFSTLKPFKENSQMSVFEFLHRFEAYTFGKGDELKRADLLFNEYLDHEVQERVAQYKQDYNMMKKALVTVYGNVRTITANIFNSLLKETLPSDTSQDTVTCRYYKKLNCAVQQILELTRVDGMPLEDLEGHIYSVEFLQQLKELLPKAAKFKYMENLKKAGRNHITASGQKSLQIFAATVTDEFDLFNGSVASDKSKLMWNTATTLEKPKQKAPKSPSKKAFQTVALSDSSDESECDTQEKLAHFVGKDKGKEQRKKTSNKSPKPKARENSAQKSGNQKKFKFPCALHKDEHELGECESFFKMHPSRRRQLFKTSCWNCMGSKRECKDECQNTVPRELVCEECTQYCKSQKWPVSNILFCPMKSHPKPDKKDLHQALKKYLKGYDVDKMSSVLRLAAHARVTAYHCESHGKHCKCKPKCTKTPKPIKDSKAPVFDTYLGKSCKGKDLVINTESPHDVTYVSQIININQRDVLVFYDRGANHHLVDGELANDLKFKVVTDKPSMCGTLGDNRIVSEYGTYSLCLGSEESEFYEITAQGFDLGIDPFPYCDLKGINDETRKANVIPKDAALPTFLGGQKVGIMIGLKAPMLEPVLVHQLPSGIGIYKSALRDKFGSYYCYGGPHEAFSKVNQNKKGANFSTLRAYFTKVQKAHSQAFYPALSRAIPQQLDEITTGLYTAKDSTPQATLVTAYGNLIEPTALGDEDLKQMGYQIDYSGRFMTDEETGCDHPGAQAKCTCNKNLMFKATTPIAKRKEYLDAADEALMEDVRCLECRRCKTCANSSRDMVMSLNEQAEQAAIEASVHLDTVEERVYVELPFVKEPVKFLSEKHRGSDNFSQAASIYKSQCRKNEATKEGIRSTHKDLIERGFMSKMDDLPEEHQKIISDAPFRHVMPWRAVYNENSFSTPVRMVVDASCTGINEILSKGQNKLQTIFEIILRSRCSKFLWSSDISKLYNQLYLSPSAYPYSLFLYHDSLDVEVPPEVYVQTRAWYGVTSTGNQSAAALSRVVRHVADTFPLAVNVIENDTYVDDIASATNDASTLEEQIQQVVSALKTGGFNVKYIITSGKAPPPEASSDGKTVKILGYKWAPEEDTLGLGFTEINFNRKRRGSRKPNPFPVKDPEDLNKLMLNVKITRRLVFSMIGQIFDPLGIFEPYKVQLKLDNSLLNGLDWDTPLSEELQCMWKSRFHEFLQIPKVKTPRCIVPEDAVDPDSIRLLLVADAAEHAGGAACYAGWLLRDGSYSCQLLTARSKLLTQTIPRNELEGVKLMTELAVDVKYALGDRVSEVLYFTDSTVAMCWSHTVTKRLRMFALHRVIDIRMNILGRENILDDSLPLYHIDGKLNAADFLTKRLDIKPLDISEGSVWQEGYDWMKKPFSEMPITKYGDLTVKRAEQKVVSDECFPDPYLTGHISQNLAPVLGDFHKYEDSDEDIKSAEERPIPTAFKATTKEKAGEPPIIDLRYFGYAMALTVLAVIIRFGSSKIHDMHIAKGFPGKSDCPYCKALRICDEKSFRFSGIFRDYALEYLLRIETKHLKKTLSPTKMKHFTEIDGILYYQSRLSEENQVKCIDLCTDVFFDGFEIKSLLPVVSAKSDLFLVFATYIHDYVLLHTGVEALLRKCMEKMYVIDNPREVLRAIKGKCTRCRLIAKKTLELRVMNHPDVRTDITPPFYNVQIDTVYGFRCQSHKNARGKTRQMYCLVMVCLLTGAVSILGLDGLETQDVCQALTRHGTRYGMPVKAYVDNGTQLICLDRAGFDLRDLQCRVRESCGLEVLVSTPKAHEERGRVEAKVKALRSMMQRLAVSDNAVQTSLQWETLFYKISSMLNDLPIAKSGTSNATDLGWNILTPNRLLLGRNYNRSLEGSVKIEHTANLDVLLKRNDKILQVWYGMFMERLHHLIPRPRKWVKDDPIKEGDIVIFVMTENPSLNKDVWRLGRVQKVMKPNQIQIRFPYKFLENGKSLMKTLVRSPRDISVICEVDELSVYNKDE